MTRLERYERRTDVWMACFAGAFLVLYSTPIIWDGMDPTLRGWFRVGNIAVWIVFAVDLLIRIRLADRKLLFMAKHPIDVLAVALPMLRPLRALRVFAAGQALFARGGGIVRSGQAIIGAAALLVFIGAVSVLDVERGRPEAQIESFGDALWWSLVTVTTVGYGDLVPVTGTGRIVAGALMVVGISLIGLVTATVTGWFATHFEAEEERERLADEAEAAALEQLRLRVDELHEKLDRLTAAAPEPEAGRPTSS